MDKVEKFEQTQKIEGYLEENQVSELFLGLLKQLLVQRPDKPLDFIIDVDAEVFVLLVKLVEICVDVIHLLLVGPHSLI